MPDTTTYTDDQLAVAVGAIRSFDAVVVVGAGMSAYGFPMTRELPALVWQAIDGSPVALAALRAAAGQSGSAKEILESVPVLLPTAWELLRTHHAARTEFQTAFARLDADREPSAAHTDLARLIRAGRVECVISFNWDTRLERAFSNAYGVGLPAGVLFKPHGDAARPGESWILPDEAGIVPPNVRTRIAELSARPRTLVVVGYSGSDETVVEQLLDPLEGRWPVVRIGPSATGNGALPADANGALAALVARLGADAPLHAWRYVTFDRSRDFMAALLGERLRPTDVAACPELPAAARLAARLLGSKYATVSGPSGSGKSITAFHAARRLNRAGWAVVELTRGSAASHPDIAEFLAISGRVLAVVDDAQNIEPEIRDAFRDAATDDHAVLLVSTIRLEEHDDETLMTSQAMEVVYAHCIRNLDEVGRIIVQLDDRVHRNSAYGFEDPKQRIEMAHRTTKEPWQFMFVVSGGDRRIGSGLDRIVESAAATAVFAGICIAQMLSRDDGIDRATLEAWLTNRAADTFVDGSGAIRRALLDDTLRSLTTERLVVEHDEKLRVAHIRIADRALRALGLRRENDAGANVLSWVRLALIDDGVPTAGKLWLYRVFERKDDYRHGPNRLIDQILDSDVIEAVVSQLERATGGLERGAGLNLLWAIDFDIPIGSDKAHRAAACLINWFQEMDPLEVNGFQWMMSALRSSYEEAWNSVRSAVPARTIAAVLSARGTRHSAMDWARLLTEFVPKWRDPGFETWTSDFASGTDADALSAWLADFRVDSHPFEIYDLIAELAVIRPDIAELALRACAPNIVAAFESDLADAGSNFSDWVFGLMMVVAKHAGTSAREEDDDEGDDEEADDSEEQAELASTTEQELFWGGFEDRLAPLAATTLAVFETIDWERSTQTLSGKLQHELQNIDLVLGWLARLSPAILDRVAAAYPLESLYELTQSEEAGAQRQFGFAGRILYFLSAAPGGEAIARAFLESHETEMESFPNILIRRFPDIAARCLARGQSLGIDASATQWGEVAKSIVALETVDPAAAAAHLGSYQPHLRSAFAAPPQGQHSDFRSFLVIAERIDVALLESILAECRVEDVEEAWQAANAKAPKQLRPLLELATRHEIAVTPLARALLAISTD